MDRETDDECKKRLLRYARGDGAAFDYLYGACLPIILGFAREILRTKSDDTLVDVAEEVWVCVIAAAKSYDPTPARFETWLRTIVHNRCMDFVRDKKKWKGKMHALTEQDDAPAREGEPEYVDVPVLSEKAEEALSILTAEQRLAYVLKERDGFTYDEIAAITEASAATCRERVRAAGRKLAEWRSRQGDRGVDL